jgi:hypothetical protein
MNTSSQDEAARLYAKARTLRRTMVTITLVYGAGIFAGLYYALSGGFSISDFVAENSIARIALVTSPVMITPFVIAVIGMVHIRIFNKYLRLKGVLM